MASKNIQKIVTDMDDHSKMKADARNAIQEAISNVEFKTESSVCKFIKSKMEETWGPTWHCVVGADFKGSFEHRKRCFIFADCGKLNVLLYKL